MQISLVRISLLQFFKTFQMYLAYSILGVFIHYCNVWANFGQKFAVMKKLAQKLHSPNRSNEIKLAKKRITKIYLESFEKLQ